MHSGGLTSSPLFSQSSPARVGFSLWFVSYTILVSSGGFARFHGVHNDHNLSARFMTSFVHWTLRQAYHRSSILRDALQLVFNSILHCRSIMSGRANGLLDCFCSISIDTFHSWTFHFFCIVRCLISTPSFTQHLFVALVAGPIPEGVRG